MENQETILQNEEQDNGPEKEVKVDDLIAENARLKAELLCAELGVKKECRGDVLKLSEGRSLEEILEKYPGFLDNKAKGDTGAFTSAMTADNEDLAMRRAFGL